MRTIRRLSVLLLLLALPALVTAQAAQAAQAAGPTYQKIPVSDGTLPVRWTRGLAARVIGSTQNGFDTPEIYRGVQGSGGSFRHRWWPVGCRCGS